MCPNLCFSSVKNIARFRLFQKPMNRSISDDGFSFSEVETMYEVVAAIVASSRAWENRGRRERGLEDRYYQRFATPIPRAPAAVCRIAGRLLSLRPSVKDDSRRSENCRQRQEGSGRASAQQQEAQTKEPVGILSLGNGDSTGTANFLHDLNPKSVVGRGLPRQAACHILTAGICRHQGRMIKAP
nr:hypothetical protein RNT25_00675 [arsenite-oxidising bacterium NT-25]